MFAIDASDPTPLYLQLDRAIRVAIATGRVRPGERLPTVRQLAVELRVNANTVARVYGELERAGVVQTCRGVGTFVRGLAGQSGVDSERRDQAMRLADRFLGDAATLGFAAEEAIALLKDRWLERKRENSNG